MRDFPELPEPMLHLSSQSKELSLDESRNKVEGEKSGTFQLQGGLGLLCQGSEEEHNLTNEYIF